MDAVDDEASDDENIDAPALPPRNGLRHPFI